MNIFVLAIIAILVGLPCMFIWVLFGDLISKLIQSEKANRVLGYTLFGLMLISIDLIWFE